MQSQNAPAAATAHPVILLARALGILMGVALVLAHVPVTVSALAGLGAYAGTLLALRSSWPATVTAPPAPASQPGRGRRT